MMSRMEHILIMLTIFGFIAYYLLKNSPLVN